MKKALLVVFIFSFAVANAQYQKPYFNTLSVQSGLPEAYVTATLEDDNGYLWMGTQNGLVRYDGYRLKNYDFTDEQGKPIVSLSVRNLFKDRTGKIWAFTVQNGIFYYDKAKDQFLSASKSKQTPDVLKNIHLSAFIEDRQDNIYWLVIYNYVSTKFTLCKFNSKNFTFEEFSSTATGKNYIPKTDYISIAKDGAGKIWIVGDSALSFYNEATQSFKTNAVIPQSLKGLNLIGIMADPVDRKILWLGTSDLPTTIGNLASIKGKHLLQFNTGTNLYKVFSVDSTAKYSLPASIRLPLVDSLKRVWIPTEKGISLYDRQQNHFINYNISFPQPNSFISDLAADKNGNIWMGGNFRGLYFLNIKSGQAVAYKSNNEDGSLPFYNSIDKIFFDRSGTLWVGMPFFGIASLNKERSLFASQSIGPPSTGTKNAVNKERFKIVGNQGDSICYISDTGSLYARHTATDQFEKIDLKQKDAYKFGLTVGSADNINIWIGTSGGGLFHYNRKNGSVVNYKNDAADSLTLPSDNVSTIAVEKTGKVWIGTYGKGLCSFDPQTKRFKRYSYIVNDNNTRPTANALDDDQILSLFIDKAGILWIGTNNGALNRLDTKIEKFTGYMDAEQAFFCVTKIFEDSKNRLWVGTYLSGLYLFDRASGKILRKYNEKDGLLHNTVYEINEDAKGNIWCVSERGFSILDPVTGKITSASKENKGLIGNRWPIIFKDNKGMFYFSVNTGVMRFDPSELKANPIPPAVIIESLSYHAANAKGDADTVLHALSDQKIMLKYNENKLTFQFVALHFADAANNQYAYQLEGYDKDWIEAGVQRTVTYTNLSPGKYTFKVKAANSDGVWNEKGASLNITIRPPWWKTWWAYLLYALLIIAAISSFIAYRSRKLKRDNKILEHKIKLRTHEVLEQKEELSAQRDNLEKAFAELQATQSQLIQSEKMASLGELTAGIAHEIQNPLNFVNNFSEVSLELLEEVKSEKLKAESERDADLENELLDDISQNLQKIAHHGKRADSIVKGMLQHSRSSSGKKELTDINALADEYLRLSYHGLRAKDKSFNATMKTDYDETIGKIEVMPQDIGRVLLNLFTNAFYAVAENKKLHLEGYEPVVSVTTKSVGDRIEIRVKDNGPGIPKHVLDKIFQPFFTTKPTGEGTGLGLSMSYDIVKAHGGEIKVETKVAQPPARAGSDGEDSAGRDDGSTFIIQLPKF